MRILDVIHSVDRVQGGPAEGLRQLIAAGRGLGNTHEVVTLDGPDATCVRDFPAPVHAMGPSLGNYGYTPRLVPWLRAHARQFDAVIVHGLWQYQGLATRQALRAGGVPYFVFPHGMLDPWFRRAHPLKHLKKWLYWPWAEYRVLRDAAAVFFTAEEEARLAPRSFGLYRVREAVVGYGLRLDAQAHTATASAFHARFPQTRGRRVVLFLSRIHPKKGCDLLIDAFAQAARDEPALHLVMAGPDQVGWQPALEDRARRLGVAHRITWTGMLQGELKWSAFRAAEVFALPSHQENFGIAVAEALAMGVPVLISHSINIWREIEQDGAGMVATDDVTGTRQLMIRWMALSDSQRTAMRERSVACFESRFRVETAAARMAAAIRPHVTPAVAAGSQP